MTNPSRGEIWFADLDPILGHEQGGRRPVLIISSDIFNSGPAGLVIALPLTKKHRGITLHFEIHPPEGGLKSHSSILCDAVISISKERLANKLGNVSQTTLSEINDRLKILFEL